MATPTVLDVEPLLVPIAGDNPSGRNLFYEPQYDELREARRVEDDTLQGDWKRKAKPADWDRVIELGSNLLKRLTKDLQIAAWMTEALARKRGLAGPPRRARPRPGTPGALLGHLLPQHRGRRPRVPLRTVPLPQQGPPPGHPERPADRRPGGGAVLVPPLAGGAHHRERRPARRRRRWRSLIAEGKTTSEAVRRRGGADASAVLRGPPRRPAAGARRLHGPRPVQRRALRPRCAQPDRHPQGPGRLPARHRADRPGQARAGTEPRRRDRGRGRGPRPRPRTSPTTRPSPSSAQAPRKRPRASRPRSSGGPIQSVDDAHGRIVDAAAYLRQNDPSSPVPFLVVRALRMGEVYATYPTVDPSHAGGPVERGPPGAPAARERGGVGGAPRAVGAGAGPPRGARLARSPSLRGRGDGLLGPRSLRGRRRGPRPACGPSSPTTPTCPTPS